MAFGTEPTPTGLADPPIDDLMEHADSKYALAIFAAKRARQINSYFTQLNEGLLQNVGPLVEYQNQEKPLSIAFRDRRQLIYTVPIEGLASFFIRPDT